MEYAYNEDRLATNYALLFHNVRFWHAADPNFSWRLHAADAALSIL